MPSVAEGVQRIFDSRIVAVFVCVRPACWSILTVLCGRLRVQSHSSLVFNRDNNRSVGTDCCVERVKAGVNGGCNWCIAVVNDFNPVLCFGDGNVTGTHRGEEPDADDSDDEHCEATDADSGF